MNADAVPIRHVALGTRDVDRHERTDGSSVIVNREALLPYSPDLPSRLEYWAASQPERAFLAERTPKGDWRSIGYRESLRAVRAVAQALIDRGLSAERPIVILSENGIEHALLGLGAQFAAVPYVPLSPAYSLLAADFAKLRSIVELVTPGLVFAKDGSRYARAIAGAVRPDTEVVVAGDPSAGRAVTEFDDLLATGATAEVDIRRATLGPDSVAKILFTSGSTGSPKGVINTQRMMCSNQQMIVQSYPFIEQTPPILVDWLPWNHTFGGNHNFNVVLSNGGTLYISHGKPTRDGIAETVRNVCEISPTVYYDVPKGYEMLADELQGDPGKSRAFFSRVQMLQYAGAGLSARAWDALRQLAVEAVGERIFTASTIGSTETGPMATSATWQCEETGNIGIPVPGVEMKLVPAAGKLELRFRGPNITPGYWRSPELSRAAFDEEGFYMIGDALRYADPADPSAGFFFDGRITEDFKLATGTWVSYGPMRTRILAHFAPLFADVVIAGENRNEVGVLAFADLERCRALATDILAGATTAEVLRSAVLRSCLARSLEMLSAGATGSATRVARLMLLEEPPSLSAGESTDKGSLNARAILRGRQDAVERLYAIVPAEDVVVAAADATLR